MASPYCHPTTRTVSRLVSLRPPASIVQFSLARRRSPVPAWFPSASGVHGSCTRPSLTRPVCTRAASCAASSFEPARRRPSFPWSMPARWAPAALFIAASRSNPWSRARAA